MPKVLVISENDVAPVLARTILWKKDVERVIASTESAAFEVARAFFPSLVIIDTCEPSAAARLARKLRGHAGTRRSSLVALCGAAIPAPNLEAELLAAGVNLLLSAPADPARWNSALERLLSVPRRLRMRFPVQFRPAADPSAEPQAAEALDLSMGGMLLETGSPIALRSLIEVRFRLPEVREELIAVGSIVRELKGPPVRVGLRFLGFTEDSEERIADVLASRPPERNFGRYEPMGLIGEGSMGRVYRAYDPAAQRVVAIKTLKPEHLASENAAAAEKELRRFKREAQSAARLVHPNIVTIFDVGDDYFVMELLEGATLQALIRKRGRLELEETCRILAPVARAIDYAHSRGTIHQDIKPANIIVTTAGRVKLSDFGLANPAAANNTGSGRFFGSPGYMAPEQITGETAASVPSDLYALAVTAYEALTGHRPFEGIGISHILRGSATMDASPPSTWNPTLTPMCDAVFARALARDPELRLASATAFLASLDPSAVVPDYDADAVVASQTLHVDSADPEAETLDLRHAQVLG